MPGRKNGDRIRGAMLPILSRSSIRVSAMLLNHARQESGHVEIHHHKMTKASPHYEQMEDFVAAEAGMSSVECCGPERIDNSTHCVDHASCKQPAEGRV